MATRRPLIAGNWKMNKTPDEGRQLAARQHVIADRKFLVDVRLDQALVNAFVATTDQGDALVLGQFLGDLLCQETSLRRQQHDRTGWRVAWLHVEHVLDEPFGRPFGRRGRKIDVDGHASRQGEYRAQDDG